VYSSATKKDEKIKEIIKNNLLKRLSKKCIFPPKYYYKSKFLSASKKFWNSRNPIQLFENWA